LIKPGTLSNHFLTLNKFFFHASDIPPLVVMKIRIVYILMNSPVTLLALPIGGPIEDLYEKEGIVTKKVLESQASSLTEENR
jgi:hypothetical protein